MNVVILVLYIFLLIDVKLLGGCFDLAKVPDDYCSHNPGKTCSLRNERGDSGEYE